MRILLVSIALVASAVASPTPSPKPFDVNTVDVSKISPADIDATIRHRNELAGQQISALDAQLIVIQKQADALNQATTHANELQIKIDKLAADNQKCQIDDAKKATKILKLYMIIGGLVLAIGAFLFAKFYLHIPFL
jgi:hypothetical protein